MTPDDSAPVSAALSVAPDHSALLPLIYAELRRIAAHYMKSEKHKTLHPTELVHEAYLRLVSGCPRLVQDKVHVLALMATVMRQVLVDRARARKAEKRGGDALRVTLSESLPSRGNQEDVIDLERALQRLHVEDSRSANAFVLSEYGGLTHIEIGTLLGVSERTIRGELLHARTWLHRQLAEPQKGGA